MSILKRLKKLKAPNTNMSPHGRLNNLFRKIIKGEGGIAKIPARLQRYHTFSSSSKTEAKNVLSMINDMVSDTTTFNSLIKYIIALFDPIKIKVIIEITHRTPDGEKVSVYEEDLVIQDKIKPPRVVRTGANENDNDSKKKNGSEDGASSDK